MSATIYCKIWNIQRLQPEFDWETIVLKQIPRKSGHVCVDEWFPKSTCPHWLQGSLCSQGRGPHVTLTQAPLPCDIWWLPLKLVRFARRWYASYGNTFLLLPTNEVAERWCFHRCLSVHRGGVGLPPPPKKNWPKVDGTHPAGMHSCFNMFVDEC